MSSESDPQVQKLFNSWSAKTVASILVDGQKLNDVFDIIKHQLDYLLKRQIATDKKLTELAEAGVNVAPVVIPSGPPNDPSRRISMQPMPFDPLLAESLRSEMENIKLLTRNSVESVDKKVTALEKWTQGELKALGDKMEVLTALVRETKSFQDSTTSRLDELEANYRQLSHMLSSTHESVQQQERDLAAHIKEANLQFHSIKDTLSVQELRAKHFESRISTATATVDKLHTVIEGYPTKYFANIYKDIAELSQEKASRSELEGKADMGLLFNKADQASVSALELLAEELDRRLANLKIETVDKFSHLDAKLDRRVDKIVAYCLKELRKELKQFTLAGGEEDGNNNGDGTDIGKVRCLVCNQATNQRGNTDVVFGGPHLRTTLRPRQRSHSPPTSRNQRPLSPSNTAQYNNNYNYYAGEGTATGRPLASERQGGGGGASPTPQPQHSRLAKLGASPASSPALLLSQQRGGGGGGGGGGGAEEEEEDPDFQYRTTTALLSSKTTASLPRPRPQPAAASGTGTGTGTTERTYVHLTSRPAQQPGDGPQPSPARGATPHSYKDVEERLVGKASGGNPSNQAVKQVEVLMHPRPKTAPLRRTAANVSKLQPMGLASPGLLR